MIRHCFIDQPLCRIGSAGGKITRGIQVKPRWCSHRWDAVQLENGALMIEESKSGVNTKTGLGSGSIVVPRSLRAGPVGGYTPGVGSCRLAARIGDAAAGAAAGTTVLLPEAPVENPAHIDGGGSNDQNDDDGFHG
jgi:hypothetical protein